MLLYFQNLATAQKNVNNLNENLNFDVIQYDSLFIDYMEKSENKYFINSFISEIHTIVLKQLQEENTKQEEIVLTVSAPYVPYTAEHKVSRNTTEIDSLSLLWFTNIEPQVYNYQDNWTRDSSIIECSDSTYIARLKNISTVINLSYNEKVKEYIERYTHRKSVITVQRLLGRAEFYFPIFEQIFDAYGVPLELKYLAIIESALNPVAMSRAKAAGLWQFIYSTGRAYGMTINANIDERFDPIKSTHAAARYLSNLYQTYGDWTLALAAYNCGPGNVNRAIKKSGGSKDYWVISQFLPKETQNYVPAYIGATYIMNYYKEHKIVPLEYEFPLASDTLMITNKSVSFNQISGVLGISIEQLRLLNPQYKKDLIPSVQEGYALRLPIEQTMTFLQKEKEIYAYQSVNPSEIQVASTGFKSNKTSEPSTQSEVGYLYYTIKEGDSFWGISQKFKDVSTSELLKINNFNSDSRINPGDKIKIKRI
jgi:membrane-bound lytic murein transglycosylase D